MMGKLTPKQEAFVDQFLIDMNATQAAIRAGYSEKTAYSIASENLKKPEVVEALNQKRGQLAKKTEITAERVLAEYAKIAFADMRALFDEEGQLLAPEDWPDDLSAAVSSLEVMINANDPDVRIHKIKTWDKVRALDALAKHLGLFEGNPQGADDEVDGGEIDLRAAARSIAFLMRRAVEQTGRTRSNMVIEGEKA